MAKVVGMGAETKERKTETVELTKAKEEIKELKMANKVLEKELADLNSAPEPTPKE